MVIFSIETAEDLDSALETLDIMSDPEAVAGIRRGEQDLMDGNCCSLEEVLESL